jgi:hypothetical protein
MAGETNSSPCKVCQSDNRRTFSGEIAIHFPGLKGLKKPIVWVFSYISVCLDCGATEFLVPPRELTVLRTGTLVKGAVVSLGAKDDADGDKDEGEPEP